MKHESLLIGAHTSSQGGVHQALLQGQEIGATTVQLFTANQKTWKEKVFSDEELVLWYDALESTGMRKVMSHDSYLINLGSPRPEVLHKSRALFRNELSRCHALKITFLNFHPGAALDHSVEWCLDTIVESLQQFEDLVAEGETRLLIESTAGQGSSVGYTFEQLGFLIDALHRTIKIGICLDTCHMFAAGYDITHREGWDHVLRDFDLKVGLSHLYALHVNDSVKSCGSRVDRHACLGEGAIGMESFRAMMQHPALIHLPKYLETPEGPEGWKREIKLLRGFAQ